LPFRTASRIHYEFVVHSQLRGKNRAEIPGNVRFRNAVSDREHRVTAGVRVFCRMIELNPFEPWPTACNDPGTRFAEA
jgi:hypothetical protein